MDSVTQITLGAAVGEAVGGRKVGAKAPLWGAFFGTLPDLDVLADPFITEAQSLFFHRGPSHSLLVTVVFTFLFALALHRIHNRSMSRQRWGLLVGSVLLTHIGLDCLTNYGTLVFWPFSNTRVVIGSIFIIDPLYTLPLAAGLLVALRWSPSHQCRRIANYIGLGVSSAYLALTLVNKIYVEHVFEEALQSRKHLSERVFTTPTPFNSLLWQGIAETDDGFLVGYYSLLDDDKEIDFRFLPKKYDLLGLQRENRFVERLRWFSKGYFVVRRSSADTLTIRDLRFGRNDLGLTDEGEYIFTFELHRSASGAVTGFNQTDPQLEVNETVLRRFGNRILGRTDSGATASGRSGTKRPCNSHGPSLTSR